MKISWYRDLVEWVAKRDRYEIDLDCGKQCLTTLNYPDITYTREAAKALEFSGSRFKVYSVHTVLGCHFRLRLPLKDVKK